MENFKQGADALFILLGAIMVLAMHAGFAFLELGTVRKKNQVNALVKILVDFAVSTVAYFLVGYGVAYGVHFFTGAQGLAAHNGYELVKFFFLLTFAAAIPAIVSGGIAERARLGPQLMATAVIVGLIYPFFEGLAWNQGLGLQAWLKAQFGAEFHDFAGSVVVHAVGGWIALPAVVLLGSRANRYRKDGAISAHPPSSIPFLALGAWVLVVGWFGFNVMSAQTLDKVSGLVAVNSLMAMVGGTLAALVAGRNDPGFVHNGPLAGLVAICAGGPRQAAELRPMVDAMGGTWEPLPADTFRESGTGVNTVLLCVEAPDVARQDPPEPVAKPEPMAKPAHMQPVKVADYRRAADHLMRLALSDYCACVNDGERQQWARIASRVMAVAVAGVSLLVAAYGAARLALPGLVVWGEGRELLLGASVIAVVFASFLLGLHLARRSALRQGVV